MGIKKSPIKKKKTGKSVPKNLKKESKFFEKIARYASMIKHNEVSKLLEKEKKKTNASSLRNSSKKNQFEKIRNLKSNLKTPKEKE